MENKQLNSAESIALIQRMITATREKYEKGGGNMFLIWGYTSLFVGALTTLLVYLTQNYNYLFLWWAIPIIGWPISYFVNRGKSKEVKTYIDTFINNVWYVVGAFAILFPAAGMFSAVINFMIIPFEALLLCVGVIITALTIKIKALLWGGIMASILAFLMFFIRTGEVYTYLFLAMFIVGMIIPGHILNYRGKCLKN